MRRLFVLTTLFYTLQFAATAQTAKVYGVTSHGGTNDDGVIFSFDPISNTSTVLYNFGGMDGSTPYSSLVNNEGILYGTTTFGGSYGYGVLFSYDPVNNTEAVLENFDSVTSGSYPLATLIKGDDDKLYGMTYSGGKYGNGVLFSYEPDKNKYNILHNFNKMNGEYPVGKLLKASNGLLYGMTYSGGSYNNGVLFSYDMYTAKDTVLVHFNGTNGSVPYGSLIEPQQGTLYGMTYGGGKNNDGVIFEYSIVSYKYNAVYSFNGCNGAYPMGSLMKASDNKLYGMTTSGGDSNKGVVFCYDPTTYSENVVFSFTGANGQEPYGSLSMDSITGMVYGMTRWGGNNNEGVLFSFLPTPYKESTLIHFGTVAGTYPEGDLLIIGHIIPTALAEITNAGNKSLIYPNPSKGDVYISFNEKGKHYAEINDITGKQLAMVSLNDEVSLLPTANMASGMYIIRIYDNEMHYISSTKLILQ